MRLTPKVKEILSWYESDNPGTKANLARILMHGQLGGTGQAWSSCRSTRASSTARPAASRPTPPPTTRTTISSSRSTPG